MKLAIISCGIFTRILSRVVSDCSNICRIFFLEQGLHNTPSRLRGEIQNCVDEVNAYNQSVLAAQRFDAVVLAYGLCSNGVCGVRSGDIPLVIPRTDDCIGIFLGSQARYLSYFHELGGVYWFNNAWYEQAVLPSRLRLHELSEQYKALYGEDNALYLIESELASLRNYQNAVFIRDISDCDENKEKARQAASDFGWIFQEVDGDSSMLSRLLHGDWNEKEFLVVPSNHSVVASYDDVKITAQP